MKLHDLMPNEGAKKPERKGHGISAGQEKTAGRGTKGLRSVQDLGGTFIVRVVTCLFIAATFLRVRALPSQPG